MPCHSIPESRGIWKLSVFFRHGRRTSRLGKPQTGCPQASLGASDASRTILVHTGVMAVSEKVIRQSVSLPATVAKQVAGMAKNRKLSKNRVLLELIENGIQAEKRKQEQFLALAQRFRDEEDPEAANRLGDELGRMVFGG